MDVVPNWQKIRSLQAEQKFLPETKSSCLLYSPHPLPKTPPQDQFRGTKNTLKSIYFAPAVTAWQFQPVGGQGWVFV